MGEQIDYIEQPHIIKEYMTHMFEFTQRYCLPKDQKATLDSLLYALREGRIKRVDAKEHAITRLRNAMLCRGIGGVLTEDFDLFLDNVLSHFDLAIREGVLRC